MARPRASPALALTRHRSRLIAIGFWSGALAANSASRG
jgi:hypothetical protein